MIKKKRGFTLIELLLVVGLVGALVMFSVPQFLTFNRRQVLQAAADKMVIDIKEVQSLAENGVTAGSPNVYEFHVYTSGTPDSYKLCKVNCGTGGTDLKEETLDGSLSLSQRGTTSVEVQFKVPTGEVTSSTLPAEYRICQDTLDEYFDVTVEAGGRIFRSGRGSGC